MGYDMHAGEICKVQRQLKVDGVLAFRMGEEVKIEAIDPDPEAPGFKYMVFSKALNRQVRLSGANLEHKFCPQCGLELDPREFRCIRCSWVYPGQEERQIENDFDSFKHRRADDSNGGMMV